MTASAQTSGNLVLKRTILGARRLSNYWWATVLTLGGLGFLLAGISSYTQINLLPFADPTQLIFVPQGIVMGFYGTAALALAAYLWLMISWNVGGGYNEFDKGSDKVRIIRSGFPGKDRRIEIEHPLDAVLAVRVDIKEGLNPKRALYLRLKGRPDLPLTRVGQPIALSELENQGAELARFLQVPLEGL
ncbi:photosystem I assembly protein Ycf4 [Pseudanabaena sp. FACHB-2040]|uniref:photosystem I assembly protein Ycf4 n=1 Tax=Pseudanabaena sp. FACHB-2040 TaxID=2692859 RepID=UPI001682A6A8|nr:photosystem I assembly protein Ycf4 [Pseudanabaena sp. FACHB-2040]MBD0269022.1 photosystem I assembly protein Ycf4 [Cyanobacteria bacterium Co-bin8]MBD2259578.1 photosystem I assembly protein Ycf4 [Pseudanabaena sp. FACHB-2040]